MIVMLFHSQEHNEALTVDSLVSDVRHVVFYCAALPSMVCMTCLCMLLGCASQRSL